MNLANKLTLSRIIFAPAFFVIYLLPRFYPSLFVNSAGWTIPVLWIIFIVSEITDYFDGLAARRLNLTSDFGKLFDPFADTLVQLTCFLCFIIDGIYPVNGIFPAILFLIVIYREYCILFLRNLMLKKGVTMGARIGGKIKTVAYIITVGASLLAATIERMSVCEAFLPYIKITSFILFIISVFFAVISFIDYYLIYLKTGSNNDKK